MLKEYLQSKVHNMQNSEVLSLNDGYTLVKSFDKVYFKGDNKKFRF